jgi:hypothetical protein
VLQAVLLVGLHLAGQWRHACCQPLTWALQLELPAAHLLGSQDWHLPLKVLQLQQVSLETGLVMEVEAMLVMRMMLVMLHLGCLQQRLYSSVAVTRRA